MKTIILILGGSGSGKTTLGLALGGPGGVQTDLKLEVGGKPEKSCQVIFPSGFALVGNLGRGSDHVSNMEARQRTIELLLSYPKVKFVIVNSLRASVKWDVDLITSLKAKILYVHLDISPQENLRRISARRDKNETGEMSEKTLNNVISFHERAAMVARAAENSGGKILKLVDKDSVVNSVKKLKAAL